MQGSLSACMDLRRCEAFEFKALKLPSTKSKQMLVDSPEPQNEATVVGPIHHDIAESVQKSGIRMFLVVRKHTRSVSTFILCLLILARGHCWTPPWHLQASFHDQAHARPEAAIHMSTLHNAHTKR